MILSVSFVSAGWWSDFWDDFFEEDEGLEGELATLSGVADEDLIGYWSFNNNVLDDIGDNNGENHGASFVEEGRVKGALSFDGVDDYVEINGNNDFNLNSGLSFGAWVYFNGNGKGNHIIISKKYGNSLQYAFGRYNNDHKLFIGLNTGGWRDYKSDYVLEDNQWYYILGSYDKQNVKFYVNGELIKSLSETRSINGDNSGRVVIGADANFPNWNEFTNAIIDEVKIWNRALNAEEVKREYESAPERKLIAYYKFEDNAADSSDNGNDGHNMAGDFVEAVDGKGLSFNGQSYFSVLDNEDWTFGEEFSLGLLVKIRSEDEYGSAFISHDEGGGSKNKWIFLRHENKKSPLSFHINNPGVGADWVYGNIWTPVLGKWYHIVLTKKGDVYTFYRDGIFDGEDTSSLEIPDVSHSLEIGKAESVFKFDGVMDEVKIWNYALTKQDVENEYASFNIPGFDEPDEPGVPEQVEAVGEEEFTLIALPDTQFYTETRPYIFSEQANWIIQNKDKLNIVFVTHEGDVVQTGIKKLEWDNALDSMSILDDKLPYGISIGNHDYDDLDTRDATRYNDYFPISKYENKLWWGGSHHENTYQYFNVGNLEFMIMHLEFCPRDFVLDWANQIVRENQDKRVIITTHLYMYNDSTRYVSGDHASCGPHGNNGEEQWQKFVKNHKNIFLVLSGHEPSKNSISYLKSLGDGGNHVHQILANYQNMGDGEDYKKTGYLRIMTFSPLQNKIFVKTYSPYKKEFSSLLADEFVLDYNMQEENPDNLQNQSQDQKNKSLVCLIGDIEYVLGYRKDGKYCSENFEFIDYKADEESCDNNFECASNLCSNNICIGIDKLFENSSKFKASFVNLICKIADLLNLREYEECITEYLEEDYIVGVYGDGSYGQGNYGEGVVTG